MKEENETNEDLVGISQRIFFIVIINVIVISSGKWDGSMMVVEKRVQCSGSALMKEQETHERGLLQIIFSSLTLAYLLLCIPKRHAPKKGGK